MFSLIWVLAIVVESVKFCVLGSVHVDDYDSNEERCPVFPLFDRFGFYNGKWGASRPGSVRPRGLPTSNISWLYPLVPYGID